MLSVTPDFDVTKLSRVIARWRYSRPSPSLLLPVVLLYNCDAAPSSLLPLLAAPLRRKHPASSQRSVELQKRPLANYPLFFYGEHRRKHRATREHKPSMSEWLSCTTFRRFSKGVYDAVGGGPAHFRTRTGRRHLLLLHDTNEMA